MVCADLERLVTSHNKSGLSSLLVLQEPDVTSTALFPLIALSDNLENLLLNLLSSLDIDFLGKANDGLEVNILGLRCFILLPVSLMIHLI